MLIIILFFINVNFFKIFCIVINLLITNSKNIELNVDIN